MSTEKKLRVPIPIQKYPGVSIRVSNPAAKPFELEENAGGYPSCAATVKYAPM